jgi:3-oxoacyl-[acyl-carrier-protein] synthase-3
VHHNWHRVNWSRRDVAVLFGDACGAVVLEATDKPVGLLSARIGCEADAKYAIQITNLGSAYSRLSEEFLYIGWNFEGQEVFKRAVKSMAQACEDVLKDVGLSIDDVNLVVPHQANKRILDALAKRVGIDEDRVFINVHKYGNTSAGTIPVALAESLEEGRIKPGDYVLSATFGAGLTWGAALIRWGDRVTPLNESDADLPPCDKTALEILEPHIKRYMAHSKA